MNRDEQSQLTPDLPPLVEVPDLAFPSGHRPDGPESTAEWNTDEESDNPAPAAKRRRLAA